MEHNPYAPPTAASEPSPDGELVFSPDGAVVVSSMATWMRVLSTVYYIGLALAFLFSVYALFTGQELLGVIVTFGVVAFAIATSALRNAGAEFERGVLGDDEFRLGNGFRQLRTYFVVLGIVSILQILIQGSGFILLMVK